MRIVKAEEKDSAAWDGFVSGYPRAVNYHRWAWKRVIEQAFGWKTFYLFAEENSKISGILPLVWLKSMLFGNLLCSLPFFSEAGLLADSPEARNALLAETIRLARELKVKYVELRHRGDPGLELPAKKHKVSLILPIQPDPEKLWATLPHKVRTDIRKGLKSDLTAEFGGRKLLEDFYALFSRNMRDLGTPVYSRSFFSTMLSILPEDNFICVVRHQGKPVAASFLMSYGQRVEAGWSSSRYDYLSMRPNMFLYWQILCYAGQRGFREFDFGRSTVGSGTHRFKLQWSTTEVPLHWNYWLADGRELPEVNPQNSKYRAAIWAWQHLPVSLTKWIGPPIARCLP